MKEHGTLFKADMVRALYREVDPKTQTRRLFTRHNSLVDGRRATPALWADLDFDAAWVDAGPSPAGNAGPYLKVPRRSEGTVHRVYATISIGDRLWVRETWAPEQYDAHAATVAAVEASVRKPAYRADFEGEPAYKWRPGIHMPRDACRIVLEVTALRIERLQQIGETDAIAEGITFTDYGRKCGHKGGWTEIGDCPAAENTHPQLPGWGVEPTSHMQCMHSAPAAYASLWSQINGADSWAANPFIRAYEFRRTAS
ncbi:hypothetical protein [Acidovorax cavernicola]|uniref:Uncharacterized protein n=1 Tax=Acidovorax cavernicola TaxID=1675792 RepID=A0A9X8GST1_9BURK|nr:hypothetical protein [Acidovorax cavernicola]RIX74441.1 hypothetical protein D3H34_27300 [Acidovorax cavernicola]